MQLSKRTKIRIAGLALLVATTAVYFLKVDEWGGSPLYIYLHIILTGAGVFMGFATMHPREWFK
jgi:hypothetical protein